MRQLQATLTRIFIVLESESHGLSEIEKDFLAKIGNSNGFSAQKQVISKEKIKNKSLYREWEKFFGQNLNFKRVFRPNRGIYFTTSAPKFLWGGCFYFFSKNWPQNCQKRAILHTLQANGGLEPPSPLATLLVPYIFLRRYFCFCKLKTQAQNENQKW